MTLSEYLTSKGKTVNDIEKIYHGKDNWCRCGCGGTYCELGERGFTRFINAMNKPEFSNNSQFDDSPEGYEGRWVNIPELDKDNKCYCIYFKEA